MQSQFSDVDRVLPESPLPPLPPLPPPPPPPLTAVNGTIDHDHQSSPANIIEQEGPPSSLSTQAGGESAPVGGTFQTKRLEEVASAGAAAASAPGDGATAVPVVPVAAVAAAAAAPSEAVMPAASAVVGFKRTDPQDDGDAVAPAGASAAAVPDGEAAGAVDETAGIEGDAEEEVPEPAPKRLRPIDLALQIREVTNDGSAMNMEMLVHLKEIFHAQLPKMPKEYIVRLVFDRRHRSIVLCKNGTPIGGITYRPFEAQKFGEIAFCAVLGNAQDQGHGSRLMNELKMVAVRDDLTHLHTYADNFAIGYFAKHGFTKQLTMSRDRWVQYVKDYDGGTHMECYVHPTIPYLKQGPMFTLQREWLVSRIAANSISTRVFEGLKESDFHDGTLTDRMDIPGIREAGWTEAEIKAQSRRKTDRSSAELNKEMIRIWHTIERHEAAWPFREPVDLEEVADYSSVIAHPIDLSLIRENLDEVDPHPYYQTKEALKVDMDLMISNCKTYNAQNTDYWSAANELQLKIEEVFRPREGEA